MSAPAAVGRTTESTAQRSALAVGCLVLSRLLSSPPPEKAFPIASGPTKSFCIFSSMRWLRSRLCDSVFHAFHDSVFCWADTSDSLSWRARGGGDVVIVSENVDVGV